MAFSATDAAFEGFRVVRRQPFALVFWALLYMVFFGVAFALVGGSIVSLMSSVSSLQTTGGEPSWEELQPLMQAYMTIIVVALPLGLLVSAVLTSAVSRAVLRPGEGGFGYLRLGADEMRVLAVTIILFFVMLLLMVVIGIVIGVAASLTSGTSAAAPVLILLCIAAFCLHVWLMVRLSLAVPITVAERRIAVFDSFGVTKGHFWPLLGMALLAFVMSIVVSILGSIIVTPIQMFTGGGFTALEGMDGETVMAMLQAAWPAILIGVVLQAILSALQLAVVYAPFSAAYRDIKGVEAPAT
jgi:hypothetical protein